MLGRLLPDFGRAAFADAGLHMDEAVVGMSVGDLVGIAAFASRPDATDREHASFQCGGVDRGDEAGDVDVRLKVGRVFDDQVGHGVSGL